MEEELAAIKKQADELHNQKENLSKVNEELSSSNEELKNLMTRVDADTNKTTENHKKEVNSLKENIERLAYKMNLLSDKEQAKKWLDGYLTEFVKYYDVRHPEGPEGLKSSASPRSPGLQADMQSERAINYRNKMVDDIIEALNVFDADNHKVAYLHLMLTPTDEPISFSFEYVILAVLLLRKFIDNVSVKNEIERVLFQLFQKFNIVINKEILNGKRIFWYDYGWSEEYYLKSFIWDAMLMSNKHIQEIALCVLIDFPNDRYISNIGTYGPSYTTYYYLPRNYFIVEMLQYNFPNKANTLVDAVQRVCIMEKIWCRDQFNELWCLFLEALKNNIENQNNLKKLFNSIVDIGIIDYCATTLQRLVAEKTLLHSVAENVILYCDAIKKMIESNPEMYFKFNVSDRKYLNYSYETLNSFLVVKNILGSDSSLVGHIDAIINSFKVLWYNKALQKYYGSLVLFARARIQLFNQVNRINKDDDDKISVVFQDTKITNENKRRLLDQASANGDIWAIRTRLNEMIRRKGGYSSTENSKVEIGLLEKLANDGDVESMYSLGEIYRDGGEKTLSMMWYEKAASENYSDAMVKIGYLFESDFKYKEAIVWYEKAAKLENAEGMCEVGDAENDMVLATEWLLKSVTFGIASRSYSTLA